MEGKRNIITLCGSTRHKAVFEEVCKELTLAGNLVLNLGCFGHIDSDPRISNMRKVLKELQCLRINMSDEIFVIDLDTKLGDSTQEEIRYATKRGKKVRYLSQENIINLAIIHYLCSVCGFMWPEFARPHLPKCPLCGSLYVSERDEGPPPEFDDSGTCDYCPEKEDCKKAEPYDGCWGDKMNKLYDRELHYSEISEPPNHP